MTHKELWELTEFHRQTVELANKARGGEDPLLSRMVRRKTRHLDVPAGRKLSILPPDLEDA
jgi:hypothetical protein